MSKSECSNKLKRSVVFAAPSWRWVWSWRRTTVRFCTCPSWRKGRTESLSTLAACRATHSQVRIQLLSWGKWHYVFFVCFNVSFQHFGLCIYLSITCCCVPTFIFQERIQIISSQELMLILLVLVRFLNSRPLASQSSSLVFISCFSSSVFTFLPLIMCRTLLSFTSCLFTYFSVLFYLFSLLPTLLWPHSFLLAPRVWL